MLNETRWRVTTLVAGLVLAFAGKAEPAEALEVMRWEPPFAYTNPAITQGYVPPAPATRRWTLCAVYPHLKDAYWLGVNYGMIEEARRLGVELRVFEAGGYPNLQTQRDQVKACGMNSGVDALILGAVSFDGLTDVVKTVARRMPVLASVNDIANDGITAKVGVPWYDMGRQAGEYLVQRHPGPGDAIPIAWFPGPRSSGWVPFVDRGFHDAIANSRIVIRATGWGDTDKSIQRNLVQEALDAHPDIRYLVGNALMAEAAISVLRERGLGDKVVIVSTYLTPAVYRGILRGRVLAAPTDAPVRQGRLSVDQAVAILEGRNVISHLGPVVQIVDADSVKRLDLDESLPPSQFTSQFRYLPPK